MSIITHKLTIELFQEASNELGHEEAEIVVNSTLLGLFEKDQCAYYYTFKDEVCKFNIDISLGVHEKPRSKYNSTNNDLIL